MRKTAFLLFPALLGISLVSVQAQPKNAPGSQFSAGYSWSANNRLEVGGAKADEINVHATRFSWQGSAGYSPATRLIYGLAWENFAFQSAAVSAVPDSLQSVAVDLGASHRLNGDWLFVGRISPGFFGEGKNLDGDAFNTPVLLLATWLRSPTLAWAFGLRADPFSERPVLPFVGVNWKFAPNWEFAVGMPRAGLTYSVTPALELGLGVTLQGGNFHVSRDPRPVSVGPRLDDTKLDYHEIRLGFAAEWKFREGLTLIAETGLITDQKFDYFDRGYSLDGDRALYFSVGLQGRF